MNRQRLFLGGLFSVVAGLGLWTVAAVTFQGVSGTFVDGEVLTAQDLNTLFDAVDANFVAAQAQINANETGIAGNSARIADHSASIQANATAIAANTTTIEAHTLEIAANTSGIASNTSEIAANATNIAANTTAIATNATAITALETGKVATDGDSMTGRLKIFGDTGAVGSSNPADTAAFYVGNTNASGVSAYVDSSSDQPALFVKNGGSGALIAATNGSSGVLVANNGSLSLGATSSPMITLDAATGDITLGGEVRNADGDPMLPVAWAAWAYVPFLRNTWEQKSQNIATVTNPDFGVYIIEFSGVDIVQPVVQVSLAHNGVADSIQYAPSGGNDEIWVYTLDENGNGVNSGWSMTLQRP